MRREGFELGVSRPKVVFKRGEGDEILEPIEEVVIDVDEEHSGVVVQKMNERKAEMIEMRPSGGNRLRLVFHAPTRGLIGYQGELLTDTRGTAIMNRLFHEYAPHKGDIQGRRNGVLISNDQGEAVAYAMWKLEDRGPMMIEPGCKVYKGMIVGEHTRDNDLEINVLKGKQLTNIRTRWLEGEFPPNASKTMRSGAMELAGASGPLAEPSIVYWWSRPIFPAALSPRDGESI